ncbi:CoA pyrophosphatase [Natronomonas sp. F2-12]|jgi:8-oxo-dGTP pyrophosphatase MutT (NUDIX family)|uniref:CoA pyrophosphatase n=1 Tax=Natronomonas aquatica TaxID=2841590 RepID=A0A9R1D629_9EURY|nr:CoA pyrophosphatase [Natronomonas aquatica]MCQ4332923.1 CoA pyrophosphatase [Natronomonas aquatica]
MDWERVRSHEPTAAVEGDREAAVLVPVITRPDGEHLLFTKRADHLGEHPGQMSFPGGGYEPGDEDLAATAKREAFEEVDLDPRDAEIAGRLDDIPTVTNYLVRPFVAKVPDREYVPNEAEVAEIAVLPLSALTDLENYESERRDHPYYGDIRIHYFRVDGYTVWGATGRMLVQFLELATDWTMPPEPDRIVDPDADYPI